MSVKSSCGCIKNLDRRKSPVDNPVNIAIPKVTNNAAHVEVGRADGRTNVEQGGYQIGYYCFLVEIVVVM